MKENFATSVAFQNLVTDKRKYSDTVKLSYLNIYSLRYKITDIRVLVSKFLPQYLVIYGTKNTEEFLNLQSFIENHHDMRNRKDRNKHGGGLVKKD